MYPVLLQIGSIKIYAWGTMLAVALIVIYFLLSRRFKEEGINPDYVIDLILVTVVAGLVGARLAYVFLYEWPYYSAHPLKILAIGEGGLAGLVWYGGFAGGLLAAIVYVRYRRLNFWALADMVSPYLALGYSIVRIGCFLNGCCYGKVTSSRWGVVFPGLDGLPHYPTQLYSSAINLAIFLVLLYLYRRRTFTGEVFVAYLGLYCLYRFVIEFWRENLLIGGVLTVSQWISLGVFVVTWMLYWGLKKRHKARGF